MQKRQQRKSAAAAAGEDVVWEIASEGSEGYYSADNSDFDTVGSLLAA